MDAATRAIIGVYVGNRSGSSAQQLWQSLPAVYRQYAVCYTDFWKASEQVLPLARHQAVGKETGKTSFIELADSGDLITLYAKELGDWCVKHYPLPKS